jgi:predicted TPR repeat methyltransferase
MSYANYAEQKGWQTLFCPTGADRAHFTEHLSSRLVSGSRLLDIGFGQGHVLAWSADNGVEAHGVEIQQNLLHEAQSRGYTVYPSLKEVPSEYFGLVSAFDVLEHVPKDSLDSFLLEVSRVMEHGAWFAFRVPNCQSPTGIINQFGDHTHVTMLSGPIVLAMAQDAGFVDVSFTGVRETGDPSSPLIGKLKFLSRNTRISIARFMYRLFWGTGSVPLTANVMIVGRKPQRG